MDASDETESRSILSMQELDPSPIDGPDPENEEYFPQWPDASTQSSQTKQFHAFGMPKLGLSGQRWDYWCKY